MPVTKIGSALAGQFSLKGIIVNVIVTFVSMVLIASIGNRVAQVKKLLAGF